MASISDAVDCSTAADDIAHLKHAKKGTDERKMKGVFVITPIGLVVNAATGGYNKADPKKMQIDDYNKKIDERIAEIKAACKFDDSQDQMIDAN